MNELKNKVYRSGMVSIVGRPNVGKSTLLNTIVDEKIAIVSRIPQTTRSKIRGIYTEERGQIVFIDTPGFHTGRDKLDKFMNKASINSMSDVDCIIYLVDVTRRAGEEEEKIMHKLKNVDVPLICGLNKVDMKENNLPDYIALWEKIKGKKVNEMRNFTLIALSGLKDINVDKLLDVVFCYLPVGEPLYPEDIICDYPKKLAIADIIREKYLHVLREEVPHYVGVVVEEIRMLKKRTTFIGALIYVEKETHKEIVIGRGGSVLKKVGTEARKELEELLETKVFLELNVKLEKDWRDNIELLTELGYSEE